LHGRKHKQITVTSCFYSKSWGQELSDTIC